MEINVRDHYDGPVFNEMGPAAMRDYTEAAVEEVAQHGKDMVDRNLATSLRNPTPIYQTRINIERAGTTRIINDDMVVYGPWLEGVGSRNKTTRFKGYASFRRAKQWLDARASTIAHSVLLPYLRRLQ